MDKTERLPKNLLTSVFSVYFCIDGHGTGGQYPYSFTVMAEGHPPSPEREDGSISFRRLRVKPAMTARGESPEVLSQKQNAYESNTKITHPDDPRAWRDAVLVRHSRQTPAAGARLI